MVRNSQFRFEAFNASYTEVDGQIEGINSRDISLGIPRYILALISGFPGNSLISPGYVSDTGSAELPTFVGAPTSASHTVINVTIYVFAV